MQVRKLSRWRTVILAIAALFGVPAAVFDTIQRFHSIESGLPPWATPYLPVVYLTAFVIGLAVLGTAPEDKDVDSLHEANTRLQNDIARLRAEMQPLRNREISAEDQQTMMRTIARFFSGDDAKQRFVGFIAIGNEAEVLNFRDAISAVFERAGFKIEKREWSQGSPAGATYGQGVWLMSFDNDSRQPTTAEVVTETLRAIGVVVQQAEDNFRLYKPKKPNEVILTGFRINMPEVDLLVGRK